MIGAATMQKIVKKEGPKFRMWALFQLSCMGTKAINQMFNLLMILKYRGMSLNGLDLLAKIGIGMSRQTYLAYENVAKAKHAQEVQK